MTAQEFVEEMNGFLALEVWQYDNKYVVAGTEYKLGESIADFLNLHIDLVHQPYIDMDLALEKKSYCYGIKQGPDYRNAREL